MKNYKHVSKSNNAMKLAAVASAAVMLAPVAMSSVSSFAAGQSNGVWYPVYSVVPYSTALNAGTNGTVANPYTGFNTSDVDAAVAAAKAIPTTVNNTQQINDVYNSVAPQGDKAYAAANALMFDINNDVQTNPYFQLTNDNRVNVANPAITALRSKFASINDDVKTAAGTLESTKANALATVTLTAENGATADQQANRLANNKAFQDAADNYKNTVAKYDQFSSAVKDYNKAIARLTNNGAVSEAAANAALAISKMPAADQPAAQQSFLEIQGEYLNSTSANDATAQGQVAVNKMDAAANKAVAALNALAGQSHDNKDTTKLLGVATVNYNKNYGIQIWHKDGSIVRYNDKDAKAYNALHPNQTPVKANDAKKLPGQSTWKVFNDKYTANGTTYYNLGGDQYIDAAYVNFAAVK